MRDNAEFLSSFIILVVRFLAACPREARLFFIQAVFSQSYPQKNKFFLFCKCLVKLGFLRGFLREKQMQTGKFLTKLSTDLDMASGWVS